MDTSHRRHEILVWFVALAVTMAFSLMLVRGGAPAPYGGQPEDTSAGAAGESFAPGEFVPSSTPRTVYLATGLNYPDALGAAAAAGVAMGPVLLVQQNSIPSETLAEINRLAPNRIVIVGGTAVISDTVKTTLEGLAFSPTVDRIAGANRYATAAALSADVHPTRGFYPRATWSQADGPVAGTDLAQTAASVDHTTELPGVYIISGSADLYATGSDAFVECSIYVNGVEIPESERQLSFAAGAGANESNCAADAAYVAATAGTYTISLVIDYAAASTSFDERGVFVTWMPYYPGS